jgi:hypothetical protein
VYGYDLVEQINQPVAFPFELNLRPYISPSQIIDKPHDATSPDPYTYRLYAVLQHLVYIYILIHYCE